MIAQKSTISSPLLFNSNDFSAETRQAVSGRNADFSIMQLGNIKTTQRAAVGHMENLIPSLKLAEYDVSIVTPQIVSSAVAINSTQTVNIAQSFAQLKQSIISRGTTYANNSLASRRGFVAENFITETYNVDAVIKKASDRAEVNALNTKDSPDITYDNGQKQASVKYYKDAQSSANAQSNPGYKDQARIVPSDQRKGAKTVLFDKARKNDLKGRTEVANNQRSVAGKIDSTIKGSDGVESTQLSKKNADGLAKAIKTNKDGTTSADGNQIDSILEKTGVRKKVYSAKMNNELRGIGIAAAIGLGIGFSIGFVVSLAQNGLDVSSLKYAFISGAKEGGNSAALAAGSAAVGVAMRSTIESLSGSIVSKFGIDIASEAAKNISTMCSMGIVGSITIIAFSVYNFVKLKHSGFTTKECLLRTGKSAILSFSLLIVSIVAQGIWGGPIGITVSITAGIIMTGYTVIKINHDKKLSRELTFYAIELCYPNMQFA